MTRVDFTTPWNSVLNLLDAVPGWSQLEFIAGSVAILVVAWMVFQVMLGKRGTGDLSGRPGGKKGGLGTSIPTYVFLTSLIAGCVLVPQLVGVVLYLAQGVVNACIAIFSGGGG